MRQWEADTGTFHHLQGWLETMDDGKYNYSLAGYLRPVRVDCTRGSKGRPFGGLLGQVHASSPRAIVRIAAPTSLDEATAKSLEKHLLVFEILGGWEGGRLAVVFYYCAPQKPGPVDPFLGNLEKFIIALQATHAVILMGDGNARRGTSVGDHASNARGKLWEDMESRLGLHRVRPTGKDQYTFVGPQGRSIPDHITVSHELRPIIAEARVVYEPTFGSDHRALAIDLELPAQEGTSLAAPGARTFWREVEPGSAAALEFQTEVEQWAAVWLDSSRQLGRDWSNPTEVDHIYRELTTKLHASAIKHIGERTVYLRWGSATQKRQSIKRLQSAFAVKGQVIRDAAESRHALAQLYRESSATDMSERKERAQAGETDPYSLFRAIKSSHLVPKKGLPGVLKSGDSFTADPDECMEIWVQAMKDTMSVTDAGIAGPSPPHQVEKWREECEQMEEEASRDTALIPDATDVEAAVKALKSSGAPGEDKLTASIFRLMGPVLETIVLRLLEILFEHGIPPSDWATAIICPLWKKNDPLDASNYRPIVLLSKIYKAVERALLHRLVTSRGPDGFLHSANLAYQKGISRQMALFLLTGGVLHSRWKHSDRHGNLKGSHKIYLALLDVKDAYNGVDLNRLGIDLWNRGFRGKAWLLTMRMMRNLAYRVRANGKTSWFFRGNGIPQGAVLSPRQFIIFKDALAWALRDCGAPNLGVSFEDGRLIIGAFWSDDDAILTESEDAMREALRVVEQFSISKRVRYHGFRGDKPGTAGVVIIYGAQPGGRKFFWMGTNKVKEADEGKFLGRKFRKAIEGTVRDVREILAKARSKLYLLRWAGAFSGSCSVRRLKLLGEALVFSIVRSHLSMLKTFITTTEEASRLQARILKLWAWTGKRVSPTFLLAEMGLQSIKSTLDADKVIIHDTFKSDDAGVDVRTVILGRLKDVEEGHEAGLTFEVKSIWARWGRVNELQAMTNCGSKARRSWIRSLAHNEEKASWASWREQSKETHPLRYRCQTKWGRQGYLDRGDPEGRGLKILFRAEAAALHRDTPCICGTELEDECHILLGIEEGGCPLLADFTASRDTTLKESWGVTTFAAWTSLPKLEKTAILLGAEWCLSPDQEQHLDTIIRTFLVSADSRRTNSFGLHPFKSVVASEPLNPLDLDHIEDEEVLNLLDELEEQLEEAGGKCPIFD